MDHAHNKLLICFLFILSACSSKTPEDRLLNLLEEKYANYYINNETHKKSVVADLREFLKIHKLNDENINEIKKKLSKINDGHVVLSDDRVEKNNQYVSGLKFYIGTEIVESCEECNPNVPKDKYKILKVNDSSYQKFQHDFQNNIAASTPWGRQFRVSRLLQIKTDDRETILKLKSTTGKIITTKLQWKKEVLTPGACVSGERLAEDLFKIYIMDLWCDDSAETPWSRHQILENFEKHFDTVMAHARPTDRIILELRENGGGGDEEVEYVLNSFFEKSVLLYHFKYLRKTHPGGLKWIEKYSPFKLPLWSEDEFQYTKLKHRPKNTFYTNKVVVLTSAGCFSSCETIASVLKNEKRAKIIGSKTHGGSGDPLFFPIKGTHYSLNLPTCVNWQVPGVYYEGVGVSPDIVMYQNPKSLEDNLLKAAIDLTQ